MSDLTEQPATVLESIPSTGTTQNVLTDLVHHADVHRESYRTASPWPHVVLEGLVNPEFIAAAECQELKPGLELEVSVSPRKVKAESPEPSGPAARAILDALCTTDFIAFVQELTGIPDLVADPTHYWTGVHVNPPGAFQAIHRDFRRHPVTGLFHRLTVIVYLKFRLEERIRRGARALEIRQVRLRTTGHTDRRKGRRLQHDSLGNPRHT